MPRILLADEDSGIHVGLKNSLEHEGCQVDVAHTIASIETLLDTYQYDAIIMELLLPLDGRKIPVSMLDMRNNFAKISSRANRPPIILRQCVTNPDDPWFLAHGAFKVFARPCTPGRILATLDELGVIPQLQKA